MRDEAFKTESNPEYVGYQRRLTSMKYKFLDNKSKGSDVTTLANKSTIQSMLNQLQLANELQKPIIRKFRRSVYSSFPDNIGGVDLADMQLISKHSKGIRYLLCAIDLFSKYAWVVPLEDKKGIATVNAFQSILNDSKKPKEIWVDQGSEFYTSSFKKWLKKNLIEMYSTHNEGKSVNSERFITTLKNKIYKHMTAVSKNVYFDVLNIIDKYNNTYHRTVKMKPIDVKPGSYAEYNVDSNEKDPKFQVGDHARISKCKNIFAKGYTPNWPEEVFVINKIKNTAPWTYVINSLYGEEIVGTFYEKELQKTIIKKKLKEKEINCVSNGKVIIILFIVELIKKTCIKMSFKQYFPKP